MRHRLAVLTVTGLIGALISWPQTQIAAHSHKHLD